MNINAIVPAQKKFIPLWKQWLPHEEKVTRSQRGASLCFKAQKSGLENTEETAAFTSSERQAV